jgi:Cytochrome b5-like Heme/Steroid binding domain
MGNTESEPTTGFGKPASRRNSATTGASGSGVKTTTVEGSGAASAGVNGSADASSGLKIFTRKQIAEEAGASFDVIISMRKPLLVIIHNDVYDLGPYISSHPGGDTILIDLVGRDATTAFDDIGHSTSARRIMMMYRVGTLTAMDRVKS